MHQTIEFFKVSGGGNDFLALTEPETDPSESEIAGWCARGISLGADGLFVLRRMPQAADGVRMSYFNCDGRPAALCINGTRCAARLAFHLGWANGVTRIHTGAGPLTARSAGETAIELELPPPTAPPRTVEVEVEGAIFQGEFVTVGVPHFVMSWPASLAQAPVGALGPPLRHHPAWGQGGANVDFVRFPDPHTLEIRSFERGVEAETLACGTGVLSAAAAGVKLGRTGLPLDVLTAGGFRMEVRGETDGAAIRRWSLTGDARILARGKLLPEAAIVPPPSSWSR